MTDVVQQGAGGTLSVDYVYDLFGRRISRTVAVDGDDPATPCTEHCVYDGTDVVLDFFDDDADGPNGAKGGGGI